MLPLSFRKTAFILFLPLLLMPLPVSAHNEVNIVQLASDNRNIVVSIGGKLKAPSRQKRGVSPFEFFPSPRRSQRPRVVPVVGSGFIIDVSGYIITNAHVVDELSEITVLLANGNKYPAEIIGSDRFTDIALLKISAEEPLSAIKIGNSDNIKVGQQVLAIGSPYGLDQTVTSGIVSAIGQELTRETHVPFIQTDAAINPGNSGGPLINTDGEVIGINALIISPVGAFAGLSFAIPINVAMNIQQRLRKDGVVRRGRLGIAFRRLEKSDENVFGAEGVLVDEVLPDSAAEKSGVESADVLLEVNGEKATPRNVARLIGKNAPGAEVKLIIKRRDERLVLSATLDAFDEESAAPAIIFGLQLENIPDNLREKSGLTAGVVIANIDYNNAPEDVEQLRPGDIIIGMITNQRNIAITDKQQLTGLLRPIISNKKSIAFRIWRSGRQLVIPINPD